MCIAATQLLEIHLLEKSQTVTAVITYTTPTISTRVAPAHTVKHRRAGLYTASGPLISSENSLVFVETFFIRSFRRHSARCDNQSAMTTFFAVFLQ